MSTVERIISSEARVCAECVHHDKLSTQYPCNGCIDYFALVATRFEDRNRIVHEVR